MDHSFWISKLHDHRLLKLFEITSSVNQIFLHDEIGFSNDCLFAFISIKEDKKSKVVKHNNSQFYYSKIVHANI
jgi:hypothetical protein